MARSFIIRGSGTLAEQCFITQTCPLLDAIIDTDPMVKGKALMQVSKNGIIDPHNYQLASTIIIQAYKIDPMVIKQVLPTIAATSPAILSAVHVVIWTSTRELVNYSVC